MLKLDLILTCDLMKYVIWLRFKVNHVPRTKVNGPYKNPIDFFVPFLPQPDTRHLIMLSLSLPSFLLPPCRTRCFCCCATGEHYPPFTIKFISRLWSTMKFTEYLVPLMISRSINMHKHMSCNLLESFFQLMGQHARPPYVPSSVHNLVLPQLSCIRIQV